MANACEVCGWRPPLLTGISAVMHEHHVIPRAQGGSDGWWNSVRLCPNHHSIAHVALYGGRVAGDLYRPRSAAHLIAALRLLDRLPSEEQRA